MVRIKGKCQNEKEHQMKKYGSAGFVQVSEID
jgi:hypothetical protein